MARTILLADDNGDSRTVYGTLLEHRGFRILEAADGEEAARKSRETVPDLVVLNLVMPALDGHGVLQRLRADPVTAEIPCILLTGDVRLEQRGRAVMNGADAVLTKPATPSEVVDMIEGLLAERFPLDGDA